MGGRIDVGNISKYSRSIEMLNLVTCQVWQTLIEDNESLARTHAPVTAISPQKIVVFGGF